MTFGAGPLTPTAPTGASTTPAYTTDTADVCSVDEMSGVLTLVGVGTCDVTVTAPGNANYEERTADFTVTVLPLGTLMLTLDTIATDDIVNIAEKAAGFTIAGETGSVGEVAITVSVGGQTLTATSASTGSAIRSVSVPANATYITGTGVTVTVDAAKDRSGYPTGRHDGVAISGGLEPAEPGIAIRNDSTLI